MSQNDTVPSGLTEENNYTYFAFISYKSADEKWARWLKRNLQRYRLPAKTHRKHPHAEKRCSPVFLDKTNLTPGLLDSGLTEEVQSSRYLIVICSRKAAESSKYLDDELRYFLEGSGDLSRVIPFIVDKSDHPVEECFPAYLAQLCKERDIAGVSIYDDGPRSALLRLIAAMLGIKREELESDDLRRRKRQRLAAAVLALCLAAGGGICWDYFRTKTAWYADYTEVYGVPQGIGELGKSERNSMNAHYTLISSRRRVRELRYENSAGSLVPETRVSRLDPFSRAEYEYAGERLSAVRQYDENGHLTAELHYINPNTVDLVKSPDTESGAVFSAAAPLPSHSTGVLPGDRKEQEYRSNVIRYLLTYDASGYTDEVHYCSDAYNHFARDADGIAGIRWERDGQGRVVRLYWLTFVAPDGTDATKTENYAVIGKRSGEAGMSFAYDSRGDCTELHILDARGQALTDPASGASAVYEYEGHNEVRKTCRDAQGSLFWNDEGYAVRESAYDAQGNQIKVSYFGLDGEPVLCAEGYAIEETVCDGRGKPVRFSFFGTDAKPVLSAYGYAGYTCSYDERGFQTGAAYFGTEGEPVLSTDGYAGWEALYDDHGNLIRVGYFGTRSEPVVGGEGYAGWEAVFDERGNETGVRYFGADGGPVLNIEGYAGWESVFDERGNEVKVTFLGVDGRPALQGYGIAGYEAVYDERGNRVRVSYFDGDGKPVLSQFGYAGFERTYDERGNEVRCGFFGVNGEPVLETHGTAGYECVYDACGNRIRRSYFGVDGEPVLYAGDSYAAMEYAFDERGNEIRRSYFGLNGEPVLVNGYHGWQSVFDEHGNEVCCRFFGMDGEPVLHVKGYAGWESAFDERGNEIRRSYFGLDGEAVLCADGYAAAEYRYDERGQLIQTVFYDEAGRVLSES